MVMFLGGCGDPGPPWALRDITGLLPPLAFELHDGNGQIRRATDFAGQVVMVYFGYSHCPDICPTTLARLSGAVSGLGADAGRVSILFVSVDPARDTPEVLRRYARAFGPGVVGLSGSPEQLSELAKRYRVTYGLGPADAEGRYEVSHSSGVFIFDRRGRAHLLASSADTELDLKTDLKRLLSGGPEGAP